MGKFGFGFDTTAEEVANALESEIAGKTVLITGVSPGGLGAEAARVIALHRPALIILAGRSVAKGKQTEQSLHEQSPHINTRLLSLDLGNLQSVKDAAAEVNLYGETIDILINNAGIMALPSLTRTWDDFEMHFAILGAGPGARIVNVSSNGYTYSSVHFEDPNYQHRDYEKWGAYGQSKSANILFSKALAEKLGTSGILSYSLHPGAIATNLGRALIEEDYEIAKKTMPDLKFKTIGQGAATYIAAAFDPSIRDINGAFLVDSTPAALAETATWLFDMSGPQKLWEMSENLVGRKFSY